MANNCYETSWKIVKGVEVLTIAGSDYVAAPCTGRRNAARFDIINVEAGEYACQLLKSEVRSWLIRQAESEGVPFNAYSALLATPLEPRGDTTFHGVVPQPSWDAS